MWRKGQIRSTRTGVWMNDSIVDVAVNVITPLMSLQHRCDVTFADSDGSPGERKES